MANEGFEEAFHELFTTAYAVTRRLLGDIGDAEDAAAEAVARALLAWRRVGNRPHRQAWVARVATNVAIDQLRRRRRAAPLSAEASPDPTENAAVRMALGAALRGLSRRQRQVVALRYLADLDEAAVAGSLGISVNSVKKHTQRGIGALRDRLGPTGRRSALASNDDFGPRRSEDELRALVQQKATRVRARRRRATVGALAVGVAVLFGSAAVAQLGEAPKTRVRTAHGGSTTPSEVVTVPVGGIPPPPVSSTVPSETAASTIPPPFFGTTLPHGGRAPTPVTPRQTPPAEAGRPETTTTAPRPPVCAAADLVVSATTDRPTYTPGQMVNVTMSVESRSPVQCTLGRDPGMDILDASGHLVSSVRIVDMFTFGFDGEPPPGLTDPGQIRTIPFNWTQGGCANQPGPSGQSLIFQPGRTARAG